MKQSPSIKRKAGRPKKAIATVIADRPFASDQYTVVRGYLKGVEPLKACYQYLSREVAPKTTPAAMRSIAALMNLIADIGSSREILGQPEANEQQVKACMAMRAAADACETQRRRFIAGSTAVQARKKQKLEEAAKAANLKPAYHANTLRLPHQFESLKQFDLYYDRLKRPDYPPDKLELQALFQEHLADWYEEQGYYYKPDLEFLDTEFTEREAPKSDNKVRTALPQPIALAAERALFALEWTIQRTPNASDKVSAWFDPDIVKHLHASDVFTLYTLSQLINQRGKNWWRSISGLGPTRAKRINTWLLESKIHGCELRDGIFGGIQRKRLKEILKESSDRPALPALSEIGLDPLSPYVNDEYINGTHGQFMRPNNILKATNDIDALIVTLGKYKDRPKTLTLYSREASRFFLWAYREKKLAVSSLGVEDAREFREFLARIPADWIDQSNDVSPRHTKEWRPFRGQLDESSQRKALTCVNVVLKQMMEAGYLVGNPMAGVLKQASFAKAKTDVTRSFTDDEWALITDTIAQEVQRANDAAPNSKRSALPFLRRTQTALFLLHTTGLRRDELFRARLGHIEKRRVDGEVVYLLSVTGKRMKERQIPIPAEVMAMIMAHLSDRPSSFDRDLKAESVRLRTPLISVLAATVKANQIDERENTNSLPIDDRILIQNRSYADPSGSLSPEGLLSSLKTLFRVCAASATDRGLDPEKLTSASTHWLRHTFGHTMVDAGVDIRSVQRAMGHGNINTTAAYSKVDMEQMVRELKAGVAKAPSLKGLQVADSMLLTRHDQPDDTSSSN